MSLMTSQTESVGFDPQLTTTRNCCVSVNLPEQPCGRVPFTGRQCFIWTLALNHYRCTVCPRRRKKKGATQKGLDMAAGALLFPGGCAPSAR